MAEQILLNRIRTPDGTVLTSYHRHDYKSYQDANGQLYMVDGGLSYLRRNLNVGAPYEDLSVSLSDDHEANRRAFHWGSRGEYGDQPLHYRPLAELDKAHIMAILETQTHIKDSFVEGLMRAELAYRE